MMRPKSIIFLQANWSCPFGFHLWYTFDLISWWSSVIDHDHAVVQRLDIMYIDRLAMIERWAAVHAMDEPEHDSF